VRAGTARSRIGGSGGCVGHATAICPNRFAELLPRQETQASHCSECSTALNAWEGQAGPRTYRFSARDIGHALALVARGDSYRTAAADTRTHAQRSLNGRRGWGRQTRIRNLDGQLAANWVDVFAGVVAEPLRPTQWPERVAVDSVEFRVGGVRGRSFHIFVAVGYDPPSYSNRVWLMRPYARKNQASWEAFSRSLTGRPGASWPTWTGRSPTPSAPRSCAPVTPRRRTTCANCTCVDRSKTRSHRCSVSRTKSGACSTTPSPVRARGRRSSRPSETRTRTGHPLPGAMRWLGNNGTFTAQQTATRPPGGPYSVGAVEATIQTVRGHLLERTQRLGDRIRATLLLDLLTIGLNKQVNERAFAKHVRLHLEAQAGRAARQRPHDDPKGQPSLFI
jgi:hypothetical protein